MSETEVYYGTIPCQGTTGKGTECTNKAYFKVKDEHLCGVHSKKCTNRVELPKNPQRGKQKEEKLEEENVEIERYRQKNVKKGLRGKVTCVKMRMMSEVEYLPGYLRVFPNFKHENRKDGFGCKSLSPMSLGPIEHGQPGLPDSLNLENFHQGDKKFEFETMKEFKKKRKEMYLDLVPHRHKYDRALLKKQNDNINVPECSIFRDEEGEDKCYTYIQSRYFYCHFYELLAKQTKCYTELREMLQDGYNLAIFGYDAYPPSDDIYSDYKDPARPFGHELVLYCLLNIEEPSEYPWNIYYRKHKKLYPGYLAPQ